MTMEIITRQLVAENQRTCITAELFGVQFPLQLEPFVFATAAGLSADYTGGYWQFYTLNNGGFYMAPEDGRYQVCSPNGYEGLLSADAFGIAVCLFAYSHLAFGQQQDFTEGCAWQYHWLRDYLHGHAEAGTVLAVCD